MADDLPIDDGQMPSEYADLAALLSNPELWEDPSPATGDAIVTTITAEAALTAELTRTATTGEVATISPLRRRLVPVVVGIAAALLVVVGVSVALDSGTGSDPRVDEVAMVGTDLAPDASAYAVIADTPLGTVIHLDLSGLPPAPAGAYYEAWLRTGPEVGVSAGTFHLRGGDGEVELWSGVSTDDYPIVTVTLQEEGGGTASSAQVVLRGTVSD